jgi:hypothetical protein
MVIALWVMQWELSDLLSAVRYGVIKQSPKVPFRTDLLGVLL